jgi:DNA polymerase I-like protein with 3'-5' exonuclease and polymerase domains
MLVSCDAAGLEWRTIVELSRDSVAMGEIVGGADTHSLNQSAFDLPSRLIAKIYLFRTIFRGSGYAFANDPEFMHVSTSPQYWDDVGVKFFAKYSGINAKHNEWKDAVVSGEPLVGPTGRQWVVSMGRDKQGNLKIPWTILTNYPVQGTGADVMMIARISFARRLKMSGIPALLISTVHDSIVVDCESRYVQAVVNLFYQVFDDLVDNIRKTFGYDWQVPLGCEVKMGMDMLNMKVVDRTDK